MKWTKYHCSTIINNVKHCITTSINTCFQQPEDGTVTVVLIIIVYSYVTDWVT